ncbi:MAG: class II aldolase/adducin family protein [Pseudomonadales bacterium]|nr:class II aldolase/adducin family protein [Pseudomonadales bacterium]
MNTAEKSLKDSVTPEEWQTRVNLAACYRLIAKHGWDDLIFTHISARVPGPEEHFLINAYGMLFEEITASSLVKVDLHGNIVQDTGYPVNPAGFTIHSAIHEARADAGCVLHTHTRAGIAVSTQEDGLLPLSQISMLPCSSLAYHEYEGIALNEEEKPRLVADLGTNNFMILRNHGLLTVGQSIPEAFLFMYALETACQTQVMAQSTQQSLRLIDPRIVAGVKAQVQLVTKGLGGDLAWPALLRKLDRLDPSYKD